ncbi:MAG: hypothetical protein ACI4SN_07385 [Lachnospiraceae bacterium]
MIRARNLPDGIFPYIIGAGTGTDAGYRTQKKRGKQTWQNHWRRTGYSIPEN